MQESILNFEEIDAHVNEHFTDSAPLAAMTKAQANTQLCSIYKTVRPILVAGSKIVPKKWGLAIKAFLGLMDVLCP